MDIIFWNSLRGTFGDKLSTPSRYIGPYKLKYWLEKHGYSGQVIDYVTYLSQEQLYTATKKFISEETAVIAISTTFIIKDLEKWSDGSFNMFPENICNVAMQLKKEFPKLKIILGGYGSEHFYGIPHFDAVVMSYTEACEDILLEYMDYIKLKKQPPFSKLLTSFINVPNGKSRMFYFQAREKKYNIEHDDFKWDIKDNILNGETLPLDISRGCIFACRFCSYPHIGKTKTDYIRGMEYVEQELLDNYNKFGTTNYMILDDTFNESQEKMRAFLNMTDRLPFKINYSAYIRVDLIARMPDTAYMLRDSGLWGAFHGIESMHPHGSKILGKGWNGTAEAKIFIPKLYHDMWNSKVPQLLNYMLGMPKEDLNDVFNTLHWFKDNNLYSIAYEPLYLKNPNISQSRVTITSEFDRNSEKYGFNFYEDQSEWKNGFSWYNETWNPKILFDGIGEIYKFIDDNKLRKVSIWNLGNMQLLGYDKQSLLTTYKGDYDVEEHNRRVTNMIQEYFEKLIKI